MGVKVQSCSPPGLHGQQLKIFMFGSQPLASVCTHCLCAGLSLLSRVIPFVLKLTASVTIIHFDRHARKKQDMPCDERLSC